MIEADPEMFDLVFTDVVMPGTNGVELAQEIRRRWPDLPVVLTSGYSHVLAEEGSHGFELLQEALFAGGRHRHPAQPAAAARRGGLGRRRQSRAAGQHLAADPRHCLAVTTWADRGSSPPAS